jgi:HD-GYP domain-containing protein (c-di-GMP phosphodiesterase class II)
MQHPSVSVRIIADVAFLKQEVPMIRHHHERPDGRGYPDGLSGAAIPLGARILAVADALEAMTRARPYREALSLPAALEELRSGAGRCFDEQAVEAALQCAAEATDWPVSAATEPAAAAASAPPHA